MQSWGPGRHFSSGRHTSTSARRASGRLPGTPDRFRQHVLVVLVAALALISAATIYATIQAREPVFAEPPAPAATTATAAGAAPTAPSPPAPAPVPTPSATAVVPPTPAIGPALDEEINGVIQSNSAYRVGVALVDVADGAVHEYGAKNKFVAASTAKILAAASYYHLVETGKASLGARMGASTSGQQIRQMVQQSNNESWALIMAAIGARALTNYAAALDIPYDRSVNSLTPAEMAKTLTELYSGRLLNAVNTRQLLSYMQKTNFETLIPAAVPSGVTVFHKYGLLNGYLHDASILVKGDRAYVFVVYTQGRDLSDMAARTRVIHQLTTTVTAGLF